MGAAKPSSSCSESGSVAGPVADSGSKQVKSCGDCNTTKTPLWRSGPAGPKTLCNACGIKYNKKRRQKPGVAKKEKKDKGKMRAAAAVGGGADGESGGLEESLKRQLVSLGGEIILRGKRSGKVLSTLREEEQAAMLLMAMSCAN